MKRSFQILAYLCVTSSLVACKTETAEQTTKHQQVEIPVAEQEAGWEVLFDGQDLRHFRNFGKKSISPKWEVKDGVLTLTGKGGGDLITKKQYSSFELTLDYKISKGGNSGVMFHVTEDKEKPWMTGPEVQIQDDVDGHDPLKSGWLYALYPAPIDTTNPAGEWNTLRVIITAEKCEHFMNGEKYCEYVIGSEDWHKKVASSKFAKFDSFGKAGKGHICLQDHGNIVSFRNVKVKDLSEQ